MGAIKNYFKQEFQRTRFFLEYESVSDFYLGSFQASASPLPLMLVRGLLFLGCIGIILASIILTASYNAGAFWPIYLTHWGLVFITAASGFGFFISVKAYFQGNIEDAVGLPWYIKAYWVFYNIAVPLAIFITVFYWIFLSGANEDFAVNSVLDIFIHAINSILMIFLLVSARHPTYVLHFYFVILLAIIYAVFSVIYYFAGGTDPFGNGFIYPVLDWSNPGPAILTLILSIVLVIIIHFIIVLISIARDAFGRSCRNETSTFSPARY